MVQSLLEAGFSDAIIRDVLSSGYIIKAWASGGDSPSYSISDMFYGSKALSSSFEQEEFFAYLRNQRSPKRAPPLRRTRVKSIFDIDRVLQESSRTQSLEEGSLSFRGQPREYRIKRAIPNPFRRDNDGMELSIMPGAYRQADLANYDCSIPIEETCALKEFASDFEPERDPFDLAWTHDLIRTEQHYSTQTMGLDAAFDINSALFFATHKFSWDVQGKAYYEKVRRGEHQGVIYLFRFGSPTVRRTEFLIREFNFFKTHKPERLLRQDCGLPYFHSYERNIAVTEVDCVLELDSDFEAPVRAPEHMFPNISENRFYKKLLELKNAYPDELSSVVEYRWAFK